MLSLSVLIVSALLQSLAAVLSVRLIRLTGRLTAWLLLTSVMTLQAIRRIVTIAEVTSGHTNAELLDSSMGLLISIGMLAVVWLIKDHFETMAKSEERFRTVADFTSDMEMWQGPEGNCLYISPSCEKITGRSPASFLADPECFERMIDPRDLPQWRSHLTSNLANAPEEQSSCEIEFRIQKPNGEIRWLGHVCVPVWDSAGNPLGRRISNRDITERKRTEENLRAASRYSRNLIEASLDPLVTISAEGKITDTNSATEKATGVNREDLIGSDFADYFTDPQLARSGYEKAFAWGQVVDYPLSIRHVSGAVTDVLYNATVYRDEHGEVLGVFAAARDITLLKQAEAEKADLEAKNRQLQKAESLGLMAGAIAHHFNNKLQSVMANLEMLNELPQGLDPAPWLARAKQAAEQAAEVSNLMLIYLGHTSGEKHPHSFSQLCEKALTTLQDKLPENLAVELACPSPGPVIHANANQIQQVLNHLIANAREALGNQNGTLRLTLRTCPAGTILPMAHGFPINWHPQNSDYACLEVADSGCGIANSDIEKLFDPFFSTKFVGRGLGLPAVLGIVQAHGGAIFVESKLGQGSLFRILLPVSDQAIASETKPLPTSSPSHSEGTILLVDDDEMLLTATGALIERMGFSLLVAKDGVEAVEVFRKHMDEIRCVPTDLTMPRMDGWETLTALRQLNPNIPVILASGYDKSKVMSDMPGDQHPQSILSKPFNLKQLREALDQAIGSPGS